jgi:uncharacterized protein YeaO (DUF488 family)
MNSIPPATWKTNDSKKKGNKTMINVKSIFANASDDDGFRILVEPVWPKKAPHGKTVTWLRYLTPSLELYNRFASDMISWEDFIIQYHRELDQERKSLRDLQVYSRNGGLTLLYGRQYGSQYCRCPEDILRKGS